MGVSHSSYDMRERSLSLINRCLHHLSQECNPSARNAATEDNTSDMHTCMRSTIEIEGLTEETNVYIP